MLGISNGELECNTDWRTPHAALTRLAQQRAAADAEEGRWLLAAWRASVHAHLGFGSFVEYVGRLFGYRPRSIHEKLRVAEALERLPALAGALETGALNWSAARELTRVAVADTEHAWLELSAGKTLRQLEELVAGKHPGDSPNATPDPVAMRCVLRFEVTAETYALLREALAELRRRCSSPLDDDAALIELARSVLGGSALSDSALSDSALDGTALDGTALSGPVRIGQRDEGRSSYQIALSLCPRCSSARLTAGGELVPVDAAVMEMAECDGQHFVPETELETDATPRSTPAAAHVGTGPKPPRTRRASARAQQSVPPALRRAVMHRDQHRCRVPGCRNATFLDVHHLQLRSHGGANTHANLLALCTAHHRALHDGRLRIQGDANGGLRFSHADGREYGQLAVQPAPPVPAPRAPEVPDPAACDLLAKVSAGLRGLGFRAADVQRVMAELQELAELREAPAADWVRAALRRLHRPVACLVR